MCVYLHLSLSFSIANVVNLALISSPTHTLFRFSPSYHSFHPVYVYISISHCLNVIWEQNTYTLFEIQKAEIHTLIVIRCIILITNHTHKTQSIKINQKGINKFTKNVYNLHFETDFWDDQT